MQNNSYFVIMIFKKINDCKAFPTQKIENLKKFYSFLTTSSFAKEIQHKSLLEISQFLLKPCIYKKR